jgi:predicted MFS family arabinose efflux permease
MYPAVTRTSKLRRARPVLRVGFALRAIAVAILAVAFLSGKGGAPLALAGFVVLVLAWPLLGVSGAALAAQEKGQALGLFNACSSLAAAAGAVVGGWTMVLVGYGALEHGGSGRRRPRGAALTWRE